MSFRKWFGPVFACIILLAFLWPAGGMLNGAGENRFNVDRFNASYQALEEGENTGKMIRFLDQCIQNYPKVRLPLINKKFNFLLKRKMIREAVPVAVERDSLYGGGSPKKGLDVVYLYLILKDHGNAVAWLEKCEQRGYKNFSFLENDMRFEPLRNHAGFTSLIRRLKKAAGVGLPVKSFTARALNGKTVSTGELRGKVVLIDFWATYCPPCVRGIREIRDWYPRLHPEGFEIIGISLDKNLTKVRSFLEKEKIRWINVCSGDSGNDRIWKLYGPANTPSYWLVDRRGILREVGLEGDQLKKAVERLLKE